MAFRRKQPVCFVLGVLSVAAVQVLAALPKVISALALMLRFSELWENVQFPSQQVLVPLQAEGPPLNS